MLPATYEARTGQDLDSLRPEQAERPERSRETRDTTEEGLPLDGESPERRCRAMDSSERHRIDLTEAAKRGELKKLRCDAGHPRSSCYGRPEASVDNGS